MIDEETGEVVQRISYDPYGRITQLEDDYLDGPGAGSVAFQPFGYAGGITDHDTGLVRFGARDYDPVTARWTSKDPSGMLGGINLYAYCAGDPVNLVDVDGNHPALAVALPSIATGMAAGAASSIVFQCLFTGHVDWWQVAFDAALGGVFGYASPFISKGVGIALGRLGALAKGLGARIGRYLPTGGRKVAAARAAGRQIANRIANGHAWGKHGAEFADLGIATADDFARHVETVISQAGKAETRALSNGRTAYWHSSSNTIVIHNPRAMDMGTAFRPRKGISYFNALE